MTIYNKPTDLPAWAESGDKVQPTNAEIQTGWPLSTVPPSRQRFNWLLNWLATGVRYFMQRGIPEWDITEEYPAGARVQYNNVTYVSLTGTSNTGQQPDTATAFWEQWAYTDTAFQPRVDQITAFAVTTADVTLTAAQAKAGILNVTGTLTGNRNIIIPNTARRLIVINGTSGAFTLSVKTASGVAVAVGQGSASSIVCDGNNNIKLASADLTAYAPIASPTFTGNPAAPTPAQFDNDTSLATTEFVQRALGNFKALVEKTATATLAAADSGAIVLYTGVTASQTLTLPLTSAMPNGGAFLFENHSSVDVTIARQGTDIIRLKNGVTPTSVVLAPGDSLLVTYYKAGEWAAVGGSTQLENAPALRKNVGTDQTWQNVTASRAAGTTYTNTTGKPIMVFVRGAASAIGGNFTITVNGTTIGSTTQGYTSNALNSASFIVPNGQTYSITAISNTLSLWTELR